MDRRTLIAVFLSITIYWAWALIWGPKPTDELPGEDLPIAQLEEAPSEQPAVPAEAPRPVVRDLPEREVPFEGCRSRGVWSSSGASLQSVTLPEYRAPFDMTPIWAWIGGRITGSQDGAWKPYGEEPGPVAVLGPDALALSPGAGGLDAPPAPMEIVRADPQEVVFQGDLGDGVQVEQRATVDPEDPCVVRLEVTWMHSGGGTPPEALWLGLHDDLPPAAGGLTARYRSVRHPVAYVDGDMRADEVPEEPGAEAILNGPVSWAGLTSRYFGVFLLPDDTNVRVAFSRRERAGAEGALGGVHVLVPGLEANETRTDRFQVYVGPLELALLGRVHPDLPAVVDLGWFAFFAYPLVWLLQLFHMALGQWGLAIVALTVFVKLLFFPLTQKGFKSSQAMSALQPRMQEIREKYKDNQEEMNRRTMELFKEHGVNPLGGCLPMLIQFPVWIALYNVLLSVVELYHTEFLYLRDLSSIDPYGILPAVVVVLMMVQQRFTPTGNMDPMQARMLKLMPLIFGVFFFSFPSGLVVYIFVNMTLSILQQWWIKKRLGGAETAAEAT